MIKLISMQNPGESRKQVLKIQVLEGRLERDTETFGSMDPYFVIEDHLNNVYRTSTQQDAGKNPKWNHFLEVPIESLDDTLRIAVYDEDFINDTLIGEGHYKASMLLGKNSPGITQTLAIKFRSKKAGEITISCTLDYIERKNSDGSVKIKLDENNYKTSGVGSTSKSPNFKMVGGQTPGSRNANFKS